MSDATTGTPGSNEPVARMLPEQIMARYKQTIICLLIEQRLEGKTFHAPIGTAWVVDTHTVASTGDILARLKRELAEGKHVVAYSAHLGETLDVTDIRLHPKFDPGDTLNSRSRLHNVGLATLARPVRCLNTQWNRLTDTGWESGRPVTLLGYFVVAEQQLTDLKTLASPQLLGHRSGVSKGTYAVPGKADDELPLLSLDIEGGQNASGWPVFDGSGRLMGTYVASESMDLVVPIDLIPTATRFWE